MSKSLKRYLKHLFVPHRGNAYRPHALRHKALSFYSVLLIFAQLLFGATIYAGPVMAGSNDNIIKNIITLTNVERSKTGAGDLYENTLLDKAANDKLSDMFSKNYWDHTGPNGETAWKFIEKENYRYLLAGENLARGFSRSEEVIDAWMDSPTHRENILNDKFQEIGVAVGTGKIKGNLTTIIVQLFGQPQTAFAASKVQKTTVLGEQRLLPEFSVQNATESSKAPYFVAWVFILGLIVLDGVMIRRLGLHTSKSHVFDFRMSLFLAVLVFALLGIGFAGIA